MSDGSQFILGDCLEIMRGLPDGHADFVLCSPPYEAARTYGIDFKLRGQAWVDWCVPRFLECLRVCKGAVCWVVAGQTRNYRWSATPALLMADLHRAGVNLRDPRIYHRVGIPGSGGPDDLRHDYEFCVFATPKGRLPWSDPTAMGHPPKWAPGGEMSYRVTDGTRRNQWGGHETGASNRRTNGAKEKKFRPSHRVHTKSRADGSDEIQQYVPPVLANPGNIIRCKVGGGLLGSPLAHANEAPFPESLAEFFIRTYCPPGGLVLDPFSGSGTTVAVAIRCGRHGLGIDIRASQIELGKRRTAEIQAELIP